MNAPLAALRAQRWDIYGPIHKGLRLAHGRLMTRLGAADYARDRAAVTAELAEHLRLCAKHLKHEDIHFHPAIEARAPGGTAALEAAHDEHHERMEALERAMEALKIASIEDAPVLGRALYLQFSHFVAADFEHMAFEESEIWPQLCAFYSDEELAGFEMAIIEALPPEDTVAYLRLMIPAMNPAERAGFLGGMKLSAPPEAFAAVIEQAARPTLSAEDFAELDRLGLAA
ncbi:MAG: hemerythrin domain-containing protein [Proteobacteria bacterium]|nr:hemerythrin domain-containing protein [Pseudomonadota bacterium]